MILKRISIKNIEAQHSDGNPWWWNTTCKLYLIKKFLALKYVMKKCYDLLCNTLLIICAKVSTQYMIHCWRYGNRKFNQLDSKMSLGYGWAWLHQQLITLDKQSAVLLFIVFNGCTVLVDIACITSHTKCWCNAFLVTCHFQKFVVFLAVKMAAHEEWITPIYTLLCPIQSIGKTSMGYKTLSK